MVAMPNDIQAFGMIKNRQKDLGTIPQDGVTKSGVQRRVSINLVSINPKVNLSVFVGKCPYEGRLIKSFINQVL